MKFEFDIQFFGGGSSSEQYRKRDPEDPALTGLRNELINKIMPGLQAYDPTGWQKASERAEWAQGQQQNLIERLPGVLDLQQSLISQIPELMGQAPGMINQALDMAGKTSGMVDKATGLLGQAPGMINQAMNMAGQIPGMIGQASGLLGQAPGMINQALNMAGQIPGMIGQATSLMGRAPGMLDQMSELAGRLPGMLDRFTEGQNKSESILDEMLGVVRSGNVPQEFTDRMNQSVTKDLQSGMGNMLNNLGARGVLNSSITSQGTSRLAQQAADAYNKNYLNAYNSVLGGYAQGLQGAQANAANTLGGANALSGGLSAMGSGLNALSNAANTYYTGANTLNNAAGTYLGGANAMGNLANSYYAGANTLNNAAGTYLGGANALGNLANGYYGGANTLNNAAGTYLGGANALGGIANTYAGAANAMSGGANALSNAIGAIGSIPGQAYENATAGLMPAFNMWKTWQTLYNNSEDYDTVVQQGGGSCITGDTKVTLSTGEDIPVSELKDSDEIWVWDFEGGCIATAPLTAFFKRSGEGYNVIRVEFEDGTSVGVIKEHLFFDLALGEFVAINSDSQDFIGHEFAKVNDDGEVIPVKVKAIYLDGQTKEAYAPQAEGHLNFLANGFITGNDGQWGLCNRFVVDVSKMRYDPDKKEADLLKYGRLDYAELSDIVSKEFFYKNRCDEFSVAIGKWLLPLEGLRMYLKMFSRWFFDVKE